MYDLSGTVLQTLSIDVDNAVADAVGNKYEPEGLSLVKDPITEQRYLYFTLMFGLVETTSKKNVCCCTLQRKIWAGSRFGNEMLWTIWYNGGSGDVEIASMLKNGRKGCVVKDRLGQRVGHLLKDITVEEIPILCFKRQLVGMLHSSTGLGWAYELAEGR